MKPDSGRAPVRVSAAILCTVATIVLVVAAGCGGSPSSTSSSSSSHSSAPARASVSSSRRAALSACLKKQGVTPPRRRPGAGRFGPGLPFGGARRFNDPKLRAALEKCGVRPGAGRRFRRSNPAFRRSLQRFAACVRKNGYDLPAPNTSGHGPIFNTRGINTNDPKFKAAVAKCRSVLRGPGAAGGRGARGGGGST